MATFISRTPGPQVQAQLGPQVRNEARVDLSPLARGAQAVGGAVADIAEQQMRRIDTAKIAEGRTALEGWWNSTRDPNNPQGLSAYRGENGLQAEAKLLPGLDEVISTTTANMTPRQREQFELVAGQFRTQIHGQLVTHASQESERAIGLRNTALVDTLQSSAARYGMDGDLASMDATLDELTAATERIATDYGLPANVAKADAAKARSAAYRQAVLGALARDPDAAGALYDRVGKQMTANDALAVEQALVPAWRSQQVDTAARSALDGGPITATAPAGFDDAVSLVLQSEGGYANDPDDRGGETNFGISSRAHPDVDVRNLSQDQARQLYRDRYWNAIGADKLPQAIRGIAFDAAVNQGPELAKRWAKESNGDPRKYAGLRLAHYQTLADKDPSQRKFLRGWTERVARYVGGSAGPAQDLAEARTRLRSSPLASDPKLLRAAEQQVAAEFQYRKIVQAEQDRDTGNGIFEKVTGAEPATPLSKLLSPAEITFLAQNPNVGEAINRYRTLTSSGQVVKDDPLIVDQLARMQATDPGQFRTFPLATVADRLSGQTLLRFTEDQQQVNKPGKQEQWATEAQVIDLAADSIGLNTARTAEFRLAYFREKRAWMQQNGNREPSADQAQEIANKLKLPFVKAGFLGFGGGTRHAFQGAAEGYNVPVGERAEIVAALRDAGNANPTEQQIVTAYLRGAGSDL